VGFQVLNFGDANAGYSKNVLGRGADRVLKRAGAAISSIHFMFEVRNIYSHKSESERELR
jgi:hypothetical protein